jgi:hypothetical protein
LLAQKSGIPVPQSRVENIAGEPVLLLRRDINLWRIPLQLSLAAVALFAITLIPDILDQYGVIHKPSWLPMGSSTTRARSCRR